MATVTLKDVSAGATQHSLNLAIHDREFAVVCGPVGSRISSILRLVAGLEDASQGDILFDDRRVNEVAPKDRDVGLLTRDYVPYPRLSVFENLAIGLRRGKFAEAEIKKRISAVATALGLEAQLEGDASELSREQQLFVGLARAMVRQPKIYLFDEPFSDLEPAAARRGRAEIAKLHQRSSATIIYATTCPAEALAFGQRTVVLLDDVVEQDAVAKNIYDAPANLAVARFFGDPSMNLVPGTLKQERTGVVFSEAGDGTISVPLAANQSVAVNDLVGKPVVLGFHPGDIEIDSAATEGKQGLASFRALVERAEPKGSGTDLYLQTGAHALIASSQLWGESGAGGHRLQFRITMEKAHLFDAETGRRVT
ncbi:MAG TPA: ABC transporter ATP-binding protein [Chthoniobacterales bacterium]|jgi:multiple sugar transport system ATP-binding protein|nr:ABC transporter ATP-binding protein [Chthoniobacterales bacterium]